MSKHTPIECQEQPGYYHIPGASNYVISRRGHCLSHGNGWWKELTPIKGATGYISLNVQYDSEPPFRKTKLRHRLLMLVFSYPEHAHPDTLEVNHIDGIQGHDELDNLEWVTKQENITHFLQSGKARTSAIPVAVRNYDTKEVTIFPSLQAYATDQGVHRSAIAVRLYRGAHRLWSDGHQIRYWTEENKDAPWPDPDPDDLMAYQSGLRNEVIVYSISLKKEKVFSNMTAASEFFQYSSGVLSRILARPEQFLIKGDYLVKFAKDPTPWRQIDDVYMEQCRVARRNVEESGIAGVSIPVKIRHSFTKEERIYGSAITCAHAMGLNKTSIAYRLQSKGSHPFKDGWCYMFYDEDPLLQARSTQ